MKDICKLIKRFISTDENSIAVTKIVGSGVIMSLLGMFFIQQYALQFVNKGLIFSSAALVAFASLGVGGLIGFLFAIPKSLNNIDDVKGDIHSSEEDRKIEQKVRKKARLFVGNTNLEQISDWLTKILVGAGLTQIPALLSNIKKLVTFIAPALSGDLASSNEIPQEVGQSVSQSVTLAILVYFSFCGFLWFYLWARPDLPRKLTDANENMDNQNLL